MGIRETLLDKLAKEITPLERELKVELPRQLAEAAAHGDLSENAEYDYAKQRKEIVQTRLAELYRKKKSLMAINEAMVRRDAIGFWSTVQLYDMDGGEELTYTLVSSDESAPAEGRISMTSPIGRALLGRKAGDEVEVQTPRGTRSYEILEFTTMHEEPDSS
jgi:transcription elongation factor GreA